MELYLLRHGKAFDIGAGGAQDDFSRALTEKGIEEMESEARAMRRLGVKPDLIVSSPLVRATETAQIVAKRLGLKKVLLKSELLSPGLDLSGLRTLVDQYDAAESIMLVGHEPDLSAVIGDLMGARGESVEMKKGGLALLSFARPVKRGAGILQWLIPPRILLA